MVAAYSLHLLPQSKVSSGLGKDGSHHPPTVSAPGACSLKSSAACVSDRPCSTGGMTMVELTQFGTRGAFRKIDRPRGEFWQPSDAA